MVALDIVDLDATQAKTDKAGWHTAARGGERETDEVILKRLIERHFKYTGSTRARNLLDDLQAGSVDAVVIGEDDSHASPPTSSC